MHSSEIIEEIVCELEGHRWDAMFLSETWRQDKAEYGRHITNTFSWVPGDTTTNTALELCWTRSGGTELLTLNTSTNGPSPPQSWSTASASNWWVCTSPTRGIPTITSRKCTRRSRSTQQIAKDTYRLFEETSMQHRDLDSEENVQMLVGWNIGWCYKITQHSTRCTERQVRTSKRKRKANRLHTNQEKILETQ